jgi:hypothetical protein
MQPLPRGVSTWRSDRPYINPWGAVLSGRLNAIADALETNNRGYITMTTNWSTPRLVEHQYNIPLRALYLHIHPFYDILEAMAVPVLPTMAPPPPTPRTPEPATLDSALASLGFLIERGSGPVTRLPARPPTYGMIRQ